MPRSFDPGGKLGDRIGPKLVDLAVQATLATRRGLAHHEATVRQAATQGIIDRAGLEVAEHYRELLAPLLRGDHGPLHPDMAAHLERAVAGTDQWHSLSSLLTGGVQGGLGSAISNALFPLTGELNRIDRNTPVDAQSAAAAVAAGLASFGAGDGTAAAYGYTESAFDLMVQLSQTPPDAGTLAELVNRGLISEEMMRAWLERAAVPADLRGPIIAMRRRLLTPADAALAVLRGSMDHGAGQAIAARNGLDAADFATLIDNTGEPLGLMQLLEAYRRGIIDEHRLERGIRQSRVRDEWIPTAKALRYEPMSTADAADAALRGHLTQDQAADIAALNGQRPGDWPAYWANQGNPPAPEQLLELWRRGYLTQAQVETGIRQGRTRDQWIPAVLDLRYEPLSTADALDAWQRGHLTKEAAGKIAEENGLLPRDVPTAMANTGNPLALEQLLEAFRRGFIDQARLEQGIREGRTRDDWITTAVKLRHSPMSTADAVEAAIQGWITEDRARELAEQNGLDPADFPALYKTAGEPLSRQELTDLYQRGEITRERTVQGLRESRLKDTWIDDALKLRVRLPQERQILQLIEHGVISHEQGHAELVKLGYTPQVAGWLVTEAELAATGRTRELAAAQIVALYEAKIVGRGQAAGMLEKIHYSGGTAGLMLDLADHTRRMKILQTGVTGVRSRYLAHKIDKVTARADLIALELPNDAVDLYMQAWGIERAAYTKTLTPAQVVKAHKMALFDPDHPKVNTQIAMARLAQQGYDETDATLLLAGA